MRGRHGGTRPSQQDTMLLPRRLLVAGSAYALCAGLTTCALDNGTQPSRNLGSLAFRLEVPPDLSLFAGTGLEITQLHIRLTKRPQGPVVLDRTVPFSIDSLSLRLNLPVPQTTPSDSVDALIEFQTSTGRTLFSTTATVKLQSGTSTPAALPPPVYLGPGGNVAFLNIAPRDTTVAGGSSVLFQVFAVDSNDGIVPPESVYVHWSTSDSVNVRIAATGVLLAPSAAGQVWVYASTPSGAKDSTMLFYLGGSIRVIPDSVEKLPGGTQQFTLSNAPAGTYVWSVNGTVGGNSTFGTIDAAGFYTAPSAVPNPAKFNVCATLSTDQTKSGCAIVVITTVFTAGEDVIVINDMNPFDANAMNDPNNQRLVQNLVTFTSTSPRGSGTAVIYDRGRNSPCFADGECGDVQQFLIDSVITAQGMTISKIDVFTPIAAIPANVKVLFLWNPAIQYDTAEVNEMKKFASEGGRIVFIGENVSFYGSQGIAVENQLLVDMGSQLTNQGATIDCGYNTLPDTVLRAHQVTTGMTGWTMACASQAIPGPNDQPLIYDRTNTIVVAGVAKIDVTPLPAPPPAVRAARPASSRPGVVPPQTPGTGGSRP